jgi:hypothetical protein
MNSTKTATNIVSTTKGREQERAPNNIRKMPGMGVRKGRKKKKKREHLNKAGLRSSFLHKNHGDSVLSLSSLPLHTSTLRTHPLSRKKGKQTYNRTTRRARVQMWLRSSFLHKNHGDSVLSVSSLPLHPTMPASLASAKQPTTTPTHTTRDRNTCSPVDEIEKMKNDTVEEGSGQVSCI